MAERVESFEVVTAAGVPTSAPVTTTLSMLDGELERLEIIIPPGPSGLVGFRVRHSGQVVIPFSGGGWIISDDEKISWPLSGFPTGNKWSIQSYNTDIYPHTLEFRFHLNELGGPLPLYPAPIMDV